MSILSVLDDRAVDTLPTQFITNGGLPAIFLPGWRPLFVYTGLRPVMILVLQHAEGTYAPWFLDQTMSRLGGYCDELEPPVRLDLAARCCALFDLLWDGLIVRPGVNAIDQDVLDFFALPPSIRDALLQFHLASAPVATAYRGIEAADSGLAGGQVADLGDRQVLLGLGYLEQIFHPHRVQDQNIACLTTGRFTFPSPVDGKDVAASGAVYLALNCYAYRFIDTVNALTFYVICSEIYFRPVCLYIPAARLVLAPAIDLIRVQFPELTRQFHAHAVQYGADIAAGWERWRETPTHIWYGITALHLGHVLWNDISGIERIALSVPRERLPAIVLFDAAVQPEMYGPLDAIFPELSGRIVREEGGFIAGIPHLYRQRSFPMRQAGMAVTRNVRDRIMAVIDRDPAWEAEISDAATTSRSSPLIMLGLRTENRTILDLPEFCAAFVRHLAETLGEATVVVDGHNSRGEAPGQFIWSHGEVGRASKPPIQIERDIVAIMQAAGRDTGVSIRSTVGGPVSQSLIWSRAARCFLTPWGAGLAKYRWVANKPGLVVTNRYNVVSRATSDTMNIYSSPHYMDDPAPITFIDADAVEDVPDAALVVDHGNKDPSLMNFRLDWPAAFRAFDAVLAGTVH